MFFLKKPSLVDINRQSGCCWLMNYINHYLADCWLTIDIHILHERVLHFRICRFPKRYTILTLVLTGLCYFCLYIKKLSNVNQNCIWLIIDIKHQPGGCWLMIDIHRQMSNINRTSVLSNRTSFHEFY